MPTTTLNQAMLRMQEMPVTKQQEVFDFIDFISIRNAVPQNNSHLNRENLQKKSLLGEKSTNKHCNHFR